MCAREKRYWPWKSLNVGLRGFTGPVLMVVRAMLAKADPAAEVTSGVGGVGTGIQEHRGQATHGVRHRGLC